MRLTILPFVTQYNPSETSLKKILLSSWQTTEKQPWLYLGDLLRACNSFT